MKPTPFRLSSCSLSHKLNLLRIAWIGLVFMQFFVTYYAELSGARPKFVACTRFASLCQDHISKFARTETRREGIAGVKRHFELTPMRHEELTPLSVCLTSPFLRRPATFEGHLGYARFSPSTPLFLLLTLSFYPRSGAGSSVPGIAGFMPQRSGGGNVAMRTTLEAA